MCVVLSPGQGRLWLRIMGAAILRSSPFGRPVRLYIMVTQAGTKTDFCHLTTRPQEDKRDAHSYSTCR
jgi:hypothetical protein